MNKQIYICIVSSETQTPVVPQRKREKWDGTHASDGREAGDDVYVGNSCLLRSRHCSIVVFAEKEGREQGQGVKAKSVFRGPWCGLGWGRVYKRYCFAWGGWCHQLFAVVLRSYYSPTPPVARCLRGSCQKLGAASPEPIAQQLISPSIDPSVRQSLQGFRACARQQTALE